MKHYHIIIDTNVLVSGFRSASGASFRLLELLGSSTFSVHLSIPLLYEYEEILSRRTSASPEEIDTFLAYLYNIGIKHDIYFLTRPLTFDADDDMIGELAFAANVDCIISYNVADLEPIHKELGIQILSAKQFLELLGEL